MADITKHFRATLKAVRLAQPSKDLPSVLARPAPDFSFRDVSSQLRSTLARATDIVQRSQDNFLRIAADRKACSEQECLEGDAEQLITVCRSELARLSSGAMLGDELPEQVRAHRRAVVENLQSRLQKVTRLLGEQSEIRHRRSAFQQRLAPKLRLRKTKPTSEPDDSPASRLKDSLRSQNAPSASATSAQIGSEQDEVQAFQASGDGERKEAEWSPMEEQELALENDMLFEEFSSRLTDVRSLQSRVSEIARLQQTFTENVISQASDIARVASESVTSTENVREGNEQLREAMKNRASNRFWLLFFLIVLTLSLLFLDWYNG